MLQCTDDFISHPGVLECLEKLKAKFGGKSERLMVSDILDAEGNQYVHLVQKGGGVLGIALVGYTYILEQMNIRFIRLAGTSAGAINTALMCVIKDKQQAKSMDILKILCDLKFFSFVDGHPAARLLIQYFITNADFKVRVKKWLAWTLGLQVILPVLCFLFLGIQRQIASVSIVTKFLFIVTGFYTFLIAIAVGYISYLIKRLKESGFGINPGDNFYDWIKKLMADNGVQSIKDLRERASKPVDGLRHRDPNKRQPLTDLKGDVTFITSEIVTQNKIEFPLMAEMFNLDPLTFHPAGFVRASMAIPIFFESWFINNIHCEQKEIIEAWNKLGVSDPPSMARFVDGGLLSNFPINLFYNPLVAEPRLPSFGIDLDDTLDPRVLEDHSDTSKDDASGDDDEDKHPERWSIGGFIYRLFNTSRFYYDKDFLIKYAFFQRGIGHVPLKGFGWLNFFLKDQEKLDMFVLGAKTATQFLLDFNWDEYKKERAAMQVTIQSVSTQFDMSADKKI